MASSSFEEQSSLFMNWLASQPGVKISSKIQLADLRAQLQGRAVVATEDISEHDVLFVLPRDVLLSVENSGIIEKMPEIKELDQWIGLIVTMMAENRPESRWKPYFDVLPKEFTTPMFWPETDLEELKGTTVLAQLGKTDAEEAYRDVVLPLIKKHPAVFKGVDQSLEAYHRMGSLILSYSFDVEKQSDDSEEHNDDEEEEGNEVQEEDESEDETDHVLEIDEGGDFNMEDAEEVFEIEDSENDGDDEDGAYLKAMVPLADMLNGDSDLNNAKLFYSKENLEMRAIKPIKKGEQVYNTYGDLPNSDLLRRYGYVRFGKTKNDVVEIETKMVVESVQHGLSETNLQKRIDYMVEIDEEEDEEILDDFIQVPISSSAIPKSALLLTYILMLNPTAFRNMKKQGHKPFTSISLTELKSEEQRDLWISIIRKKLAEYKSDIVMDENLVLEVKPEVNFNLRNAIEVRLSEMRILESALTKVQQWKIKDQKRRKEFSSRAAKRARKKF
ncbi:hypothetical protein V1512DRAFT_289910 [Lipomyces arxii]|uniref:uncharacterized protein n=1 Tax=Lipomyces arxii TaxID=56418 RepID=UPI0034CF29E1